MRTMTHSKHLEEESSARKFSSALSNFFRFSGQEALCIVFFAAAITFVSMFNTLQAVGLEPPQGAISSYFQSYGFPFESLRWTYTFIPGKMISHGTETPVTIVKASFEIMWLGVVVDFMIFALPLIVLTGVIVKIREEIDFRRYDKA